MTRRMRRWPVRLVAAVALLLGGIALNGWAQGGGEVVELAESKIFFEFNATDLDLGIHIFFDGEAWERVTVSGPDGMIFSVGNDGNLKQLGSTELFTESAEPPLDGANLEQAIAEFLSRFPAGTYTFEGTTIDGRTLEGTAELTHNLPAKPNITSPAAPVGDGTAVLDPENAIIEWDAVPAPPGSEIVSYQVVVEFVELDAQEEETGRVFIMSADLPGTVTSMVVSQSFFDALAELEGEFKVEVVATETSGNATISELEFELLEEAE